MDDAGAPDAVAEDLARWARSPADALGHLPGRELSEREQADVSHGRSLELAGEDGPTRCLAADGRLLVHRRAGSGRLKPRVVLEPGA